jgi:formylglycine-generating enzyme required for sulfatase activity
MKNRLIMLLDLSLTSFLCFSLILSGCSDFISTFYSTEKLSNPQLALTDSMLSINDLDQKLAMNDMKIMGGTLAGMTADMIAGTPSGAMNLDDMMLINADMGGSQMDEGICDSFFQIKIGNQEINGSGCEKWSTNLNHDQQTDMSLGIRSGNIKFSLTSDTSLACNLILDFTALSCGVDQVYQVAATLNLRDCVGLDEQYQSTYQISQTDGLIMSFKEIKINDQSNHLSSDTFVLNQLSGNLGTIFKNGITVENQLDTSFQLFLYGHFSIASQQMRNDRVNETLDHLSCDQISDIPTYDMDGDGVAIFVYGNQQDDCDDQDANISSSTLNDCLPCGDHCPEMTLISHGEFMMGSASNDSDSMSLTEQPNHHVKIQHDFYIGKTEVTVAQYRACVNAGQCVVPNISSADYCNWSNDIQAKETHPMNCVDWHQARAFAKWLGGDLPSESQWEYVARSEGKNVKYTWGDEMPSCDLANYKSCGNIGTFSVCSITDGNTIQGVCDMGGNVWEWVRDQWHDSYNNAPNVETPWCDHASCDIDGESQRVFRGGSCFDEPKALRSVFRAFGPSNSNVVNLGFRVSKSVYGKHHSYD